MNDPLVGRKFGRYEIVAFLGKGGMASVYRARDPMMEREVAIKLIKTELAESADFRRRFLREARALARLDNPYILKVFDLDEFENTIYIVTELKTGGSLAEYLRTHSGIPLDKIDRFIDQIAQALDYAHKQGIVHRDLKPQNILLDAKENLFLTDFGIAKMLTDESTEITNTGAAMGTPSYMAPEQWRSGNVDARTDVYAFGIVLYELLTGTRPFDADTPYQLMYQHVNEAPNRLALHRNDVPSGVQEVLDRALAKDQEERTASAGELAADFHKVLQGVEGRKPSPGMSQLDATQIDPPRAPLHRSGQSIHDTAYDRPVNDSGMTGILNTPPPAASNPLPPRNRKPIGLLILTGGAAFALVVIAAAVFFSRPLTVSTVTVIPTTAGGVVVVQATTGVPVEVSRTLTATQPPATVIRPTNTTLPTTALSIHTVIPPTVTTRSTDTAIPSTATARPTNTSVPPTATARPTNTSIPPTVTARPTDTPIPPTMTSRPTATPIPSTNTAVPATQAPVPPTATVRAGAINGTTILSLKRLSGLDGLGTNPDSITVSRDGKHAAFTVDELVRVLNLETSELDAACSGSQGVFVDNQTLLVVNPAGDSLRLELCNIEKQTTMALTNSTIRSAALAIAYSNASNRVVVAHADGTVRVWTLQSGALSTTPLCQLSPALSSITSLVLGSDGRWLAASTKSTPRAIYAFDVDGCKQLMGKPLLTSANVTGLAISVKDGAPLIGAGFDNGTLQSWQIAGDAPNAILAATKVHNAAVSEVVFADNGDLLSTSQDKTLKYTDTAGHSGSVNLPDEVISMRLSIDGRFIILSMKRGSVQRWGLAP